MDAAVKIDAMAMTNVIARLRFRLMAATYTF